MDRKIVMKSKPVRDTTVLCETVQCKFNDRGLCEADSIAIIDGKCGLNTTRPEAYCEEENNNISSQELHKEDTETNTKKRRVRVFAGTDWS